MADHVFTPALGKLLSGDIDLNADDIRLILVMTNTTADTETDAEFVSSLTTLDEDDGANYARAALAGETVVADLANDRGEFDANDVTFAALGNGTREVQGYLLYKHVTTDADSSLILYRDFAAPINPGGTDFVIQWNAEGILQLANA